MFKSIKYKQITTKEIKVTELIIYFVKPLAGIALQESDVDNMGLKYNRRWMLVSEDGHFLSQRTVSQMALIKTELSDGQLILSMEGQGSHSVPATNNDSKKMNVTIWDDGL